VAQFEPAVQATLIFEGDYSNNVNDAGGETYRGISRRSWPLWSGWGYVDIERSDINFPYCLDRNLGLQGNVLDFYRVNFWQYDGINNQLVANKIFDLSVNVGKVHAIKIAQGACSTVQDGLYGPNTENAINSTSNGSLLTAIKQSAIQYHESIVISHPQDAVFLKGWIARDNA
jgi:lysozyme family protein